MRNFGFSFLGDVRQSFVVNAPAPGKFGLPPASEPDLSCFALADAFEDGEPNHLSLLSWDYGLVETLYGRDEDLAKILAWATGGGNAATVRLVTGEGGAGKTRLAAAAARKLREQRWTAGFLPRHDSVLFEVAERGLFLILDYPEEQMERTRALFDKLAELKDPPYPIRLLLLSRRPFDQWVHEGAILKGRFGRQAIAAPGELGIDDAKALIAEAAGRFATVAGTAKADLTPARAWLEQSPLHALPLFAMAAAVHAVLEPNAAFGLGSARLLRDLAEREHRRVCYASRALDLGEDGLARLLALGVLADGLSQSAIKALNDAGAIDGDTRDVIGVLAQTPWWREGRLIRLQPDRPAAAFLDLALFPPTFPEGRGELPDWLFIAVSERAATFGDRLGRILYDMASLDRTEPGEHPLDRALIAMIERAPARAGAFAPVAYREASHWAASFAAKIATTLARQSAEPETRATWLNNGATYLSQLGRREDALLCAEEATGLYRELARARPDAFTPYLATSLNNLANRLSELGRREDALHCAKEAVAIRRELARARPEAFTSYLATSLNNLAAMLSELGRREDALQCAEEAVALDRALARARPDAFTHDLAMSVNNLAAMLSELGRREDALQRAEEAVAICRELARARPDAFTADLAKSLNTLAIMLAELGRREDALHCAEEAAGLYRELARARPDAFTSDLAMSLNTLANRLSELGRREDALHCDEEATGLYRELARARPDAFTPHLAGCLNNLANTTLSGLGRREDALQRAEEATGLYRELARAGPDACTPHLAGSLNTLSTMLSALGRREDALHCAEEAVAIRRQLARARPDAFTPDLAMSLNTLANRLSALGRHEDALHCAEEAVRTLAPYFLQRPAAFAPWMRVMAAVYWRACEAAGREPDLELLGPIAEGLQAMDPA